MWEERIWSIILYTLRFGVDCDSSRAPVLFMYVLLLTGLESFTCKDLHCVSVQPHASPHPHSPEALGPPSWSGSSPAPPPAGRAGWRWWSRKWLRLSYLRPPRRKVWQTHERYSEEKTTNSALFTPALQIYSCGCVIAQIFKSCWSKTVNITLWLWTIRGCQNELFFTGSIRGKEVILEKECCVGYSQRDFAV